MSTETETYRDGIINLLQTIHEGTPVIEKAAEAMAKAIMDDKLIHVIGPGGHSNMGAEELLWRAGGLAPINAILDPGTNLIHGAKRSNVIERTPGYAKQVLDAYRVGKEPGEVIIIVNAYGVNAMSIDTVLEAK
ncbi:SIS domain-containing protein, partial [Martelella radicis]